MSNFDLSKNWGGVLFSFSFFQRDSHIKSALLKCPQLEACERVFGVLANSGHRSTSIGYCFQAFVLKRLEISLSNNSSEWELNENRFGNTHRRLFTYVFLFLSCIKCYCNSLFSFACSAPRNYIATSRLVGHSHNFGCWPPASSSFWEHMYAVSIEFEERH